MKVLRGLLKVLVESPLQSDGEVLALLGESSPSGLFLYSSVGRSGGLLDSLRGGSESVDSYRDGFTEKGSTPLFICEEGVEALKLERNP